MTLPDPRELWPRLAAFRFDHDGDALPFSARLARENAWSKAHTARVLHEYRRFLLLARCAGHPVTPSVDVDQAWHLHLTYTRSYWEELCPGVLGGPLHHEPTRGGRAEGARFDDAYRRTLDSYRRIFGEAPPADLWPPAEVRLSEAARIRSVSDVSHVVIHKDRLRRLGRAVAAAAIGTALLAGCTTEEQVFGVLAAVFFVVGAGIVWWVNLPSSRRPGGRRKKQAGKAAAAADDGSGCSTDDDGVVSSAFSFLFGGDDGGDGGGGGDSGCGGGGCGGCGD